MAFSRKPRRERAPVSRPLRRLPGQSIREELDKVVNEGIAAYIFYPLGFWALVLWEFARTWLGTSFHRGTLIVAATVTTLLCAWRVILLRRDIRDLSQGEKAERHVSDLLRRLRDKDYVTFDDLVDETGGYTTNIDHVVVGPGGVFAVETKGFSVFGNRCAKIDADGVLKLSGKAAFDNPLAQARACAQKVHLHLASVLQRELWVQPVVVIPGWDVATPKTETGVVLLNDATVAEFFSTRDRVLSNQEIRDICAHLDRTARS